MLLLAYTYNSNLAYLLTFFLGSFALISMFFTHRALLHTRLSLLQSAEGCEGQPTSLSLQTDGPAMAQLEMEIRARNLPPTLQNPHLARSGEGLTHLWRLPLIPNHWGNYQLPRIEIATRYPVGLFRAWKVVPVNAQILATPQPVNHGLITRQGIGEALHAQGARGQETSEFRELSPWRPGDPRTRLDAKASARHQQDYIKNFERDQQGRIELRWDETEPLGEITARLRQMSWWIHDCQRRHFEFSVVLPNGREVRSGNQALRELTLELSATGPLEPSPHQGIRP